MAVILSRGRWVNMHDNIAWGTFHNKDVIFLIFALCMTVSRTSYLYNRNPTLEKMVFILKHEPPYLPWLLPQFYFHLQLAVICQSLPQRAHVYVQQVAWLCPHAPQWITARRPETRWRRREECTWHTCPNCSGLTNHRDPYRHHLWKKYIQNFLAPLMKYDSLQKNSMALLMNFMRH